jgi:hypothetical protein
MDLTLREESSYTILLQRPLKAVVVESEETSFTRLRLSKNHVCVSTLMHSTMEELWEAELSVGPCGCYIWRIEAQLSRSRDKEGLSSEAGSTRQPESEIVVPGGGMGSRASSIVESSCLGTPSLVAKQTLAREHGS